MNTGKFPAVMRHGKFSLAEFARTQYFDCIGLDGASIGHLSLHTDTYGAPPRVTATRLTGEVYAARNLEDAIAFLNPIVFRMEENSHDT